MIHINSFADNTLKIEVSGKLEEDDFKKITPGIDEAIKLHGSLKLLIDATAFDGWSSMHAASQHFSFVRNHHQKIERIALIADHEWQHWVVGVASVFVHPEIKIFDKDHATAAETWLRG